MFLIDVENACGIQVISSTPVQCSPSSNSRDAFNRAPPHCRDPWANAPCREICREISRSQHEPSCSEPFQQKECSIVRASICWLFRPWIVSSVDQLFADLSHSHQIDASTKDFRLVSICLLTSLLLMHIASCPASFPTVLVPSVTAAHSVVTQLEIAEKQWHCRRQCGVDHGRLRKTHETHTRVLKFGASCSTCAARALNGDGETSSPKSKPPSA